jgi:hypothetical protein
VFPEGCLVEIACGEEGEEEVWMPSQIIDIIPVEGKEEEVLEVMVPEDVDAYVVSMLGNYDEDANFEVCVVSC